MGRKSGGEIAQTEENEEKRWEEEEAGHGGLLENECVLPAPHEITEADSLHQRQLKFSKGSVSAGEERFGSLRPSSAV